MNVLDLLECCEDTYAQCDLLAGPDDRDGANVRILPDGSIGVAFRGTTATRSLQSLLDWINDFHDGLVPFTKGVGRVHAGFLASLEALWPQIVLALRQFGIDLEAEASDSRDIYLTGHSKGGAIAQLAGVWLAERHPKVVTFGSPKVGDVDFAVYYPDDITLTRYETRCDLVPFLPPFGYRAIGQAVHESGLRNYLLPLHIDRMVAQLNWEKIVEGHYLSSYRSWLSASSAPATAS